MSCYCMRGLHILLSGKLLNACNRVVIYKGVATFGQHCLLVDLSEITTKREMATNITTQEHGL